MSVQTPNMNLYQPTINVDSGLVWEQQINANATILDSHNHAAGSGVPIDPSGLNINADLTFNSNDAIALRSVRFTAQNSPLGLVTDIGCVYVSGVDLYYNDENGVQIQITSGGSVNATSSGISDGTATASFATNVLVVNQASNTPASIQGGSIIIGNTGVSGSKYVTVSPASALSANYALTLPAVSPSGTQLLVIDASGVIAPNAGVVSATVANNIASAMTSTGANAIGSTMTSSGANAVAASTSNANFGGNAVQENGKNLIVSNTNAGSSLSIVRGLVRSDGSIQQGEGFTASRVGLGNYVLTFTTAFAAFPVVTVSTVRDSYQANTVTIMSYALSTTTMGVGIYNPGIPTAVDDNFCFIAIGIRT